MRIPGIRVLLTAGIVAVTSIGTVTAFSLSSSGEADQRLPAVAPPPAAAAPLDPAPLPAAPPSPPTSPAPVAAERETPSAEPTRAAEPESDDAPARRPDTETPDRRPDPPKDDAGPKKPKVEADPNGTREQKLAYACRNGFYEGKICDRYT